MNEKQIINELRRKYSSKNLKVDWNREYSEVESFDHFNISQNNHFNLVSDLFYISLCVSNLDLHSYTRSSAPVQYKASRFTAGLDRNKFKGRKR